MAKLFVNMDDFCELHAATMYPVDFHRVRRLLGDAIYNAVTQEATAGGHTKVVVDTGRLTPAFVGE